MSVIFKKIKNLWNDSYRPKSIFFYLAVYTAFFGIAALLVFMYFPLAGKTFVWNPDGVSQHLPFLKYFLSYATEIISTFLSTGKLVIPQWDFAIGFGGDIFTSLSNAGIFDPINYFALLLKDFDFYQIYAFLVIIRIYFAGLTFSAFCLSFRWNKSHILIGSLTYAFCGFTLYAAVRQPFFMNPMIYLPLLLLGFEWILQKKKPYLFIFITALSLFVNFYFFFMMTIILFVYALVRFFSYYSPEERKGKFWKLFGKSVGYYTTGIVLSAWFLLPLISAVLTSTRGEGVTADNLLLYDLNYYFKLFIGFVSPISTSGNWSVLGFTPFAIIAVVLLFNRKERKYRSLKQLFIISLIGLCIPAIGLLFTAMSYISNRWCFAFAFLVSYILVAMLPEFTRLTKKDWRNIVILFALYILICLVYPALSSRFYSYGPLLFAAAIIVLLFINNKIVISNKYLKQFFAKSVSFILIFSTIASIALSALLRYDVNYGNYVSEFIDDTNLNSIEDAANLTSSLALLPDINDNSFYRVEVEGTPESNGSLNRDYYGTSMFYSMFHDGIDDYYHMLGLTSQSTSLSYKGLSQRYSLLNLLGVKYLIAKKGSKAVIPDSMVKIAEKNGAVLYQNTNALSLGYTYDTCITQDEFATLSPVERQEIMLHAAVLEEVPHNLTKSENSSNLISNVAEVPYTISAMKGLTYEENMIKVNKANATMTLTFETPAYSENYLSFENLNVTFYSPLQNPEKFLDEEATKYDYQVLRRNNINYLPGNANVTLKVSAPGRSTSHVIRSSSYSWYTNLHDYAFHLGYSEKSITTVTIQFSKVCDVSLDSLKLYSVSMVDYEQNISERKEDELQNIVIDTNSVTGTITVDEAKLLCLTVPYHEGWRATVDGRDVEILPVNVLFSGIMLEPGAHTIELHYETPNLKTGILISTIAFFAFILIHVIIVIVYFIKRKRS